MVQLGEESLYGACLRPGKILLCPPPEPFGFVNFGLRRKWGAGGTRGKIFHHIENDLHGAADRTGILRVGFEIDQRQQAAQQEVAGNFNFLWMAGCSFVLRAGAWRALPSCAALGCSGVPANYPTQANGRLEWDTRFDRFLHFLRCQRLSRE